MVWVPGEGNGRPERGARRRGRARARRGKLRRPGRGFGSFSMGDPALLLGVAPGIQKGRARKARLADPSSPAPRNAGGILAPGLSAQEARDDRALLLELGHARGELRLEEGVEREALH